MSSLLSPPMLLPLMSSSLRLCTDVAGSASDKLASSLWRKLSSVSRVSISFAGFSRSPQRSKPCNKEEKTQCKWLQGDCMALCTHIVRPQCR